MMGSEYFRKRRKVSHVPLITIDLEGNEQNISKVRGGGRHHRQLAKI
jgi:hypothetical protein